MCVLFVRLADGFAEFDFRPAKMCFNRLQSVLVSHRERAYIGVSAKVERSALERLKNGRVEVADPSTARNKGMNEDTVFAL